MSRVILPYGPEPGPFSCSLEDYNSRLAIAFNWYNQEKEKKDARSYLRHFITHTVNKDAGKILDRASDSEIINTWGWVARMVSNGTVLSEKHQNNLNNYIKKILTRKPELPEEKIEERVVRPSVRDFMEEKIQEYIGELEGVIDEIITGDKEFDLYKDLQYRHIPVQYCPYIDTWIKQKAGLYIEVYSSADDQIKEGYSNLGKRKITQLIKTTSAWLEDLERYAQFKKANRKPKAKKTKSPAQQVEKLKYKKEDTSLSIKSIVPTDIIGSSQVWVYNTKNKKLSVYRTDSVTGIQVKNSSLQNYDPDLCEQKTLRKPDTILKQVLTLGKIPLRKLIGELSTKDSPVNGRINEECLIIRALK